MACKENTAVDATETLSSNTAAQAAGSHARRIIPRSELRRIMTHRSNAALLQNKRTAGKQRAATCNAAAANTDTRLTAHAMQISEEIHAL